ncbi:MAG: PIN domain-containing protein [Candidatus Competibacterales bacterium]|nr:PIN domain-containing protein [Candidatus Competibacterales bacterium]
MILLDTNILSALMQNQPDPVVVAWLDDQPAESIWLSSITLFEARYGIGSLADGQRKIRLQQCLEQLLQQDLQNRVCPFDAQAAAHAAQLAATRKARGRVVDMRDTFIAGIALARRATLVTRNLRHFEDLGIRVISPDDRAIG